MCSVGLGGDEAWWSKDKCYPRPGSRSEYCCPTIPGRLIHVLAYGARSKLNNVTDVLISFEA